MEMYIYKIIKNVLMTRKNLLDNKILKLIKPAKGIILYGPQGTCKTTFVKNISHILGCT